MIELSGSRNFACDECGICEELDWRLQVARELNREPQVDHCGCVKTGPNGIDEFFAAGYCEDAFRAKQPLTKDQPRQTGRAYRRRMEAIKQSRLVAICETSHSRIMGSVVEDNGHKRVSCSDKSNRTRYFKRQAHKAVRRTKVLANKGNQYRKCYDYWWTIT